MGGPPHKDPLESPCFLYQPCLKNISKKEIPTSLPTNVRSIKRGALKLTLKFQMRFGINSSVSSGWIFSAKALVAFLEGQSYLVGISRSLLLTSVALWLSYCGNHRQPPSPYFQVPSGGGLPPAENTFWGCVPQPPVGHWWAGVSVPLGCRHGPWDLPGGVNSLK